jgi:hypothetical protein
MAVQPITPQEALDAKITTIPDVVIEAVNAILTERMTRHGYISFLQKELVERIIALSVAQGQPITTQQMYDKHWLDFEPFYEKAGWKVVYDKPGYNESYEPSFTFTRR